MSVKTFHIELTECKIYTQGDDLLKVFLFSFQVVFFPKALKPAEYTQQTFSCSCLPPPWPCTLFCSNPLHVLPCSCLGFKVFKPSVVSPRVHTGPKAADDLSIIAFAIVALGRGGGGSKRERGGQGKAGLGGWTGWPEGGQREQSEVEQEHGTNAS